MFNFFTEGDATPVNKCYVTPNILVVHNGPRSIVRDYKYKGYRYKITIPRDQADRTTYLLLCQIPLVYNVLPKRPLKN